MNYIEDYLFEEALIIIPVLLIIGKIMKQTPWIRDWLIPYCLLFLGTSFTIYLLGWHVDAVLQGILLTGSVVFGNQLFKQIKERRNK